jgi:signal transduction histidine kinase/GAF domain-containing protein
MKQHFPPARRHILLALLAAVLVLLPILILISPLVVSFAPETTPQSRLNYILFTPLLTVVLLGLIYRYLTPVARLGHLLYQEEEPPPEVVHQARQVAFNAPAYLFVTLLGVIALITLLSILTSLLFIPGYEFVPHLSEVLLVIATAIIVALALALIARRQLQPVLVTTARLLARLDVRPPSTPEGWRFDIRIRLLIVILALNAVAYYLPSILAFNLVYWAAQEAAIHRHQQWAEDVIRELAPSLDDESLLHYVEEATLPDEGQAFVVDDEGHYITRPPATPPSLPGPGEQAVKGRETTLLLPLERPSHDWQLGVVYRFRAESEPLVRRTLFLLLGFGLIILALTLLSALFVTSDVSGELRRITRRLLGVGRRGEAGEQLPVLSLDEIGDLAQAFNEVQARMQAQQEALQQEHQRLLVLQAISSRTNAVFDLDRLLNELVQSVMSTCDYYNLLIFLTDEGEELHLAASARPLAPEVGERRFKIGSRELVGRVASTGTPLLISDVRQCDFCTASSPEVCSKISSPMSVGGRLVGVLEVESDQPGTLDEQGLQFVTALANQAAATIEAVRLLQESRANAMALEQRARDLMLINRISTTLNSSLDASEILNITVQHLVELSGVDYGSALISEHDGQHGRIIAEHPTRQLTDSRLLLPRSRPVQRTLELGIPYAVEDATNHPLLEPFQEQLSSLKVRSLLLVPLVARREMIGVLLLASLDQPRTFSDEERDICQTVASQAAVAVANARLLQDIQQQTWALTRKSQELTEESSKLDAILNNIADGLVVTDPTGHIILSNPAFREMAGLPSARPLYGRLLAESFPAASLPLLVGQALGAPGQVFTENLELPNGQILKTSATALRIPPPTLEPEKGTQIAGVVTVLRDITHEVEVDRMKTDFITSVSHELRTPLTSILGFTNLVQRDFRRQIVPYVKGDGEVHQIVERVLENLTIMEKESQRLTQLINNVLDIAKMEAGRMEWHMASTDLTEVIQSAVIATTALAEEKDLPIRVHLPLNGLPPVWGHRDRLIQVTTNLLSNAIKFTEQGQIEVSGYRLQISRDGTIQPETARLGTHQEALNPEPEALPPGEWAVVSVTDTGVGISAKEVPGIFEKFTQVGDTLTGKPQGTGLGLSICKGIIEHHRGYIWVESEPGQGSTFSFALPTALLQAEAPEGVNNSITEEAA